MKRLTATTSLPVVALLLSAIIAAGSPAPEMAPHPPPAGKGRTPVRLTARAHRASAHDVSSPLAAPAVRGSRNRAPGAPALALQRGGGIEQNSQGPRPPAVLLESFDGQGVGFVGPQGEGAGGNPSDNSMAVGPDHIVEIVNSRMAVYGKKGSLFDRSGTVLFGPVPTNVLFTGFGGPCEARPNGDSVVRYDQLAGRWLYVMPLFRRAPSAADEPPGPYGMCYALSTGANPLGPYYRYYFERELFPDYPRPAVWTDGYYLPTSTGDDVIEKHACVVDRDKMLRGLPATEQCIIVPDVNFLNNADIDGLALPPAGAPNIVVAAGGMQLRQLFEDDAIFVWRFHVDWEEPANTRLDGPLEIPVAPYHYLCDGQLTRCVPQPGTDNRLDSQGDKIMQRLVYRNIDGIERIVAVHSVDTAAGGGGVRWYELRLDDERDPYLYQQGTYAPDGFYRWMGSPGIDRRGDIGIGYSFGGTPNFAGQRFAARLADDPPGELSFQETVLVHGEGAQTNTLRWQDYTQLSIDPVDDCTFWYVGDYLKAGAPSYTTRIGAFRLPGCLGATVSGSAFYDLDHDGMRDPNEPGLAGWPIAYAGMRGPQDRAQPPAAELSTDSGGKFSVRLPADPAYFEPVYTFTAVPPAAAGWSRTEGGLAYAAAGPVPMTEGTYTLRLRDRDDAVGVAFGNACVVTVSGGHESGFWRGAEGRALLVAVDRPLPEGGGRRGRGGGRGGDPGWRGLINLQRNLAGPDGRFAVSPQGSFDDAYADLAGWLESDDDDPWARLSVQLAAASLSLAYGGQPGDATVRDAVVGDWPPVAELLGRVSALIGQRGAAGGARAGLELRQAEAYASLLARINGNSAMATPADPSGCPAPF